MKGLAAVVRVFVAALALTVVQALTELLLPGPRPPELPPGALPWVLASNLFVAAAATSAASRLGGSLGRAWGALFGLLYGVQLNSLVEAAVFSLDIPRGQLLRLFASGCLVSAAFALPLAWRPRPSRQDGESAPPLPERSPLDWGRRWALCAAVYVICYFAAGIAVYPFVRDFYATKALPALLPLALLQVARGSLFTAVVLPLVRGRPANRFRIAALVGVTLSVLGGIAPLLIPNPYLPDAVRWAHMVEVGLSNLVFGFVVGWVMGR